MAETVISAIDVGLELFTFAQQLPQDIATWSLNKKILPEKLCSFSSILALVGKRLQNFRESLEEAKGVPNNQFQRYDTVLNVQHCIDELKILSTIIVDLEKRERATTFLQPIVNELGRAIPAYDQLLTKIDKLSMAVERVSAIHVNTTVWADAVSPDYFFDLEYINRKGPVTKVFDNILSANNHPIGAVLVGNGGMGKTTAVCRVAWDVKIKMQFQDGVLFTALGIESSETDIIAKVASLVQCVDRQDIFQEIRDAASIDEAVKKASLAFRGKSCLIVFDDVWPERITSVNIVVALSKLVTCDSTKVVFTTRDTTYLGHPLTSNVAVVFDRKGRDESERMLLKSAGLEKPSFEEGLNAFNNILDASDGLPLALSLAGNAIKQISIYRDDNSKQYAWSDYERDNFESSVKQKANTEIHLQMRLRIMKSISFMQQQTKNRKYIEFFGALSVVQKAERIPYRVLCRAFGESNSVATKIMETFKKYGIVNLRLGEYADSKMYATIHDLVLDCARSLVDNGEEMKNLLMRWVFSFRGERRETDSTMEGQNAAQSFRSWWPDTEDDEDNYLYRNIIRILKGASMFDDMVWLINEPWWIARQLKANGLQQMRIDLDVSLQCVRNITQMGQKEHNIMEKWIKLLNATITTSYDYVHRCGWDGMLYTQLYGRLQYYEEADTVVQTFLEKVKESAPRPFFLPMLGSFPSASSQLQEKFICDGDPILCKQINDCIHTLFIISARSNPQPTRIEDKSTEEDHEEILMLQVDNLLNESITKEKIMSTTYRLQSEYVQPPIFGDMSDSGHMISIGTAEGDIILLEKQVQLEGKEGGSLPQGDIDEDIVPLKQPPKKQALKRFFTKLPRKLQFTSTSKSKKKFVHKVSTAATWRSTVLRGHKEQVNSVVMPANGTRIVSSSSDNTVRVWELHIDQWKSTELRGHEASVGSVAISANGKRIVSGSHDNMLRVWEMENDQWKYTALCEHESSVSSVAMSANGTRIVSGSDDRTVRVWKSDNYQWNSAALCDHKGLVRSVAISADGTCIGSSSWDNTVRVWKGENDVWKSAALRGHEEWVRSLSISDDGTRIVSGSRDKTVRVWDVEIDRWEPTALRGHEHWVTSVAISTDGTRIVSGSDNNKVRVWQVENEQWESVALHGHDDMVWSVAISTDGTRMVSGSDDNTVRVWEVHSGQWNSVALRGHEHWVKSVAISANGTRIVSGSGDNTVRLWEVEDDHWNSVVFLGHEDLVRSVAISADGARIVSGSHDNTVRVWEVENHVWKPTSLRAHNDLVRSVAISSAGTRIVSGSHDKTIRVWEVRNEKWDLSETISFDDVVYFVRFLRNGDLIEISFGAGDCTKWWEFSNGSWRECQPSSNAIFQGHVNTGLQHSFEGSECHARLTSAQMEALDVLQSDPDLRGIRPTFNGYVAWRAGWPYFGFILII